jgi:hypothetical protein
MSVRMDPAMRIDEFFNGSDLTKSQKQLMEVIRQWTQKEVLSFPPSNFFFFALSHKHIHTYKLSLILS